MMMRARSNFAARRLALAALCLCLPGLGVRALERGTTANAADWPQWRGPHRNGISSETGLLKEWPKEGPPLVWQIHDIGDGYSTPSVAGERIYLMGNHGMDDEFLQARETSDGKLAWSAPVGKVGPNRGPQYPGARSTPTVDGDLIFALGSDGDLVCVGSKTGKPRWHKNLRTDFVGAPGNWAYSESPLIDGDVLVCTPGGAEATLVAIKKATGDVIWKAALPEGDAAGYSSVIIVETGGIKQYVQFLQKGLVGIDAKTGKLFWRYGRTAQGSPANIPTPVALNDCVYSAAGRSGGGLVKLAANGGSVSAEQVYFMANLPASIGGVVYVGGYLYGTNSQGLMSVEFLTGQVKWRQRALGPGSVCYADGRLYLHGESGEMGLIDASPESYREKGRFDPVNPPARGRSKAWAYPVVSDGRLYVRERDSLWSYDVKDRGAK